MRSAKLAWAPALATLASGLLAWMGAFTDQDAFATRALSAAVLVSLIAPAPVWARLRRPLPFLLFFGAKLVVFFALAPRGLATLGMSYSEARAGLFDDWLRYFWGLPPTLSAIAMVESWLASLALREVSVRDTGVWRHRRGLAIFLAASAACASGWWLFRGEYYLWRVHQGSAPARYSLSKVGPRVLPRLYRDLEAGRDSEALVDVIVEIRQEVVARKIGSVLYSDTEVAQVGSDPAMVAALRHALSRETEPERVKPLVQRIERADFDTVVAVFCDGFPQAPPAVQNEMVSLVVSASRLASTRVEKAAQREMRDKLRCALPFVEQALVRGLPRWPHNGAPLWALNAVTVLARFTPLSEGSRAKILAVAPRVKDEYLLRQLLNRLHILPRDKSAATSALLRIYRQSKSETVRSGLVHWARQNRGHIELQRFWCGVFPLASDEQRHSLVYLLDEQPGPENDCVVATLMAQYEKAVLSPGGYRALWLVPAHAKLRDSRDERIAPWATRLSKRADESKLWLLRDLF